jgi:hypothetical protein
MKGTVFFVIAALLWPGLSHSAQVYGSLMGQNMSGIRIEIRCGQRSYPGTTDQQGNYNIFVPEKGKCNLTVKSPENPRPYDIYSYDDPVRYDFELMRSGAQVSLRRR